jgi:hypothetical protein
MEFEWDQSKNEHNEDKHRISFQDAILVFNDPRRLKIDTTRPEYGEQRSKALGNLGPFVIAVVFTTRGDCKRIIPARRARKDERQAYDQGAAQH